MARAGDGAGARRPAPRALARGVLVAAGLVSIGVLVVHARAELADMLRRIDWGLFTLSIALAVASNFLTVLAFRALLHKHAAAVPWRVAARMFIHAQVAKYIPGKVWGLFYQAAHLQANLPSLGTVLLVNVELTGLSIVATGSVAAALIAWGAQPAAVPVIFAAGLAAAAGIYASRLVSRLAGVLARAVSGRAEAGRAATGVAGATGVAVFYCAVWFLYTGGAMLLLAAALGTGFGESAPLVAWMNLAWIAAALVMVFPAGVGIRELIFVWIAHQTHSGITLETSAAVAVVYRLWQVIQDLTGALLLECHERIGQRGPR